MARTGELSKMLPTPQASDAKRGGLNMSDRGKIGSLTEALCDEEVSNEIKRLSRRQGGATDTDGAGLPIERSRWELDEGERPERGCDVDGRSSARTGHLDELASRGREHWDWRQAPQPCVLRVAHGSSTGMDIADEDEQAERLHLLGNGVVPLAAARAFAHLESRLIK